MFLRRYSIPLSREKYDKIIQDYIISINNLEDETYRNPTTDDFRRRLLENNIKIVYVDRISVHCYLKFPTREDAILFKLEYM